MSKDERIMQYKMYMPQSVQVNAEILDDMGFFTAPASTKYHGAYEGGLFDHSLAVTKNLVNLTVNLGLKWGKSSSPYVVGMYHDLCKCDNYLLDELTGKYIYNNNQLIDGHGSKSIILLQQYLAITEEEINCIRWHMGAYETDNKLWGYYGRAIEKYPNVLYSHTADMIASKINGI